MKNNRPIRLLFAAGFLPFTPDAGRALVRLALDDKAYQQVWHLPTARPALTGREWIDLCADVMGRTPKHMTLSRPMVKLMGLFDPAVREIHEMLYQNEADYVFDSSKIERVFEVAVTPAREGVTQTVTAARAMARATY